MPEVQQPEAQPVVWRPTEEDARTARTALERLRDRIANDLDPAVCNIILYAKRGRHIEDRFRLLQTTEELAGQFKLAFEHSLASIFSNGLDNPEGLRAFGFADNVEDTISYAPVGAFGPIQDWLGQVPQDEGLEQFRRGEGFLEKLKSVFASITFLEPNQRLLIVQGKGPTQLVRRGIGARLVDGRYDRLDMEETLVFDSAIDFVIWEGHVYIARVGKFETQVEFRAATEEIARTTFEAVIASIPFGDAHAIQSNILSRPLLSKKLARLGQADYLERLNLDVIRAQIEEHGLPIRIEERNGQQFLVMADPSNPRGLMELLRLLDDDLWRSAMTGNRYTARAKDKR